MNLAKGSGRGERALLSRKVTGRPRTLTPTQERQVFWWINGKDLRQFGFDFALWTRQIVSQLIQQKLSLRLGVTAVGELLTTQQVLELCFGALARQAFDLYRAF